MCEPKVNTYKVINELFDNLSSKDKKDFINENLSVLTIDELEEYLEQQKEIQEVLYPEMIDEKGWNSCKDIFPYENKSLLYNSEQTYPVLVYDAIEGIVSIDIMCKFKCTRNKHWEWYDNVDSHITHWMPIPKLPDNKNNNQ